MIDSKRPTCPFDEFIAIWFIHDFAVQSTKKVADRGGQIADCIAGENGINQSSAQAKRIMGH